MEINGSPNLHKIVVLNPKGGSGKTTLAFNLAGYLASTGRKVALVDMDRQGSSRRWLSHRNAKLPSICGVSATSLEAPTGNDDSVTLPQNIEYAVIDAPASLQSHELIDYTCGAHAILVPVLPSDLDIHAATRLISDLLLVARVSRVNRRLGVVANRVREHTIAYRQLMHFLQRLTIAVVGVLRDSQNYTWGASQGLCIHEMPRSRVRKDLAQWESVTQWLEERLAMPLTARDLMRPATAEPPRERTLATRTLIPVAAAAALAVMVITVWFLTRAPEVSVAGREAVPLGANTAMIEPVEPTAIPPASETPISLPDVPEAADEAVVKAGPHPSPGEALKEKWELSGVAQTGPNNVVILRDRESLATRRVTADIDVEGWLVSDAGRNFAVLRHDDEEIRFELNEDRPR